MRIWIGTRPASALGEKVGADDELHILGALSGG
jgi:hypothetical protein